MEKVAGIILLTDDVVASVLFYKNLGFEIIKEVPDVATTVALDQFWIELLDKNKVVSEEYKEDINAPKNGAGSYLQIQVKNVDDFYQSVINKGIQVNGKPENYPWNHREFILIDPSGYKIAFFEPI